MRLDRATFITNALHELEYLVYIRLQTKNTFYNIIKQRDYFTMGTLGSLLARVTSISANMTQFLPVIKKTGEKEERVV